MHANQTQPATMRPWNKGKFVGQKAPLKLKEIWAIRIRLQLEDRNRDTALFNLAIDSKLHGCDLLSIRVSDVTQGSRVVLRAVVMQQKRSGLCSLKLPSRREAQFWPGFNGPI